MGTLLLGLITGIGFGYVLQRVGVTQCACLFNALSLRNTKAIKLMGTAVTVAIVILYPIVTMGGVDLGSKTLYVGGVIVGGAIFGLGFAMVGLCPGSALAALGGGKKEVLYLIAGALTGSFVYSLVYEPLVPIFIEPLNYGKLTLPDVIGAPPIVIAYVVAAIIFSGVLFLHKKDRADGQHDQNACIMPTPTNKKAS